MWKLMTGQEDPMDWGYFPLLLMVAGLGIYFVVKIKERRKIYFKKREKKKP